MVLVNHLRGDGLKNLYTKKDLLRLLLAENLVLAIFSCESIPNHNMFTLYAAELVGQEQQVQIPKLQLRRLWIVVSGACIFTAGHIV